MNYSSNRLLFRECTATDFSWYYSLVSNKQVMQYTMRDAYTAESDLMPYFEQILQNNVTAYQRNSYEYVISLADGNTPIGMGDLEINFKNEFGGCAEIGYLLLPQFWGKGYGTEIARTLLKIGFHDLQLHRIYACCNKDNTASENIMKKEGEFKKARFKNYVWHDELRYAILVETGQNIATFNSSC